MILIQFTHIRITTLPPIVMAYFFAHEPIVKGNWILLEIEPSVWREKNYHGCGNLTYQNGQAAMTMANRNTELSQANK